jgi:hypothetical protein
VRETIAERAKVAPLPGTELFAAQFLVASLEQLVAAGLSEQAVRRRVANRGLHRIHRGVYSPVPPEHEPPRGHILGAVLACGPDAVAGWSAAAAVHDLHKRIGAQLDVLSPTGRGRGIDGIRAHRVALPEQDITHVGPIPVTSIARTSLDMAAHYPRAAERVVEVAMQRHLFDRDEFDDVLDRNPRHKGAARLKTYIDKDTPTATDTPLEERFLLLCRKYRIPDPETQQWITLPDGTPIRVDFMWREQRLIVETDDRFSHQTPRAFEDDRARDAQTSLLGWRTLRFTGSHVSGQEERTAHTVLSILRA